MFRCILGIDPGTHRIGFGLVRSEGNRLSSVDFGCLEIRGHNRANGLARIRTTLREYIDRYQPTEAAVEDLFFTKNVSTGLKVAEARGVILLTLHDAGLPVREYTPNQIKQAVTGYGAAPKHQVQRMVQMLLHLPTLPKPDDAADGLAVAICASIKTVEDRQLETTQKGGR